MSASDPDPLAHVREGDPDPTPNSAIPTCPAVSDRGLCTRLPHPAHWQHIAGTGDGVLVVWTDADGTAVDL